MLVKILICVTLALAVLAGWQFRQFRSLRLRWTLSRLQRKRERVFLLQRIAELPDAYDRLLVEGILKVHNKQVKRVASPSTSEVKSFIYYRENPDLGFPKMLALLQEQEVETRARLYVLSMRGKPKDHERLVADQRAKVAELEYLANAERLQLQKLEAQSGTTDPYGRGPKVRVKESDESDELRSEDKTGARKRLN